jgi:hypothetical protein
MSLPVWYVEYHCANLKLTDYVQLNVRVSSVRSNLKKTALPEVKGFYQLIPGNECKTSMKQMTATTSYIFPRTSVRSHICLFLLSESLMD